MSAAQWGWGHMVDKGLTLYIQGHGFDPWNPHETETGLMLVESVLGRLRQVDPWGSLASQFKLIGEIQTNEKPFLKRESVHS